MHASDVELVRVYTKETGGEIFDETIPHIAAGTTFEVVVEVEAGAAIWGLNPPYELKVYVRDLMEHHEIDWHNDAAMPGPAGPPVAGNLGGADANWGSMAAQIVVPIGPSINFNKGHVFNVLAVLTVGADIVSFAESPMFVVN